jgi:rhodanese-related sulfurtransferase
MTAVITPAQLREALDRREAFDLVDVRTPAEFREAHVAVARNVPLDRLDPAPFRAESGAERAKPLYVICRSGGRGRQACEKLTAAGVARVANVEGGTVACEAAGLPMTRGKRTISLERQVRIAAGGLVLVGAVLGLLVHPYFIGLAAFVGAGLVFAGVTDTCGMAMCLARMPWNQVKESDSTPSVDSQSGCSRS